MMRPRIITVLIAGLMAVSAGAEESSNPSVIVAIGAPGTPEYATTFSKWVGHWQKASATGNIRTTIIGLDEKSSSDRGRLRQVLDSEAKTTPAPLWLALLGHGTFDGKDPKFNMRGDDLSAAELAEWLKPFQRPVVLVCGFSASGAFLKTVAAPGRVIVTATRSGGENNYARFGGAFSEAITDPAADLDKDGQTSVLEAWLSASKRVADFYKNEGRLATEHALLDDNGDGFGTPPDWFEGVRIAKKSQDKRDPDGLRAHQIHLISSSLEKALSPSKRAERDRLEVELSRLREEKSALNEAEYYAKLEELLLRLARLYRGAN